MPRLYQIIVRLKAQKQLASLPQAQRIKLSATIDSLANNPRPHGSKKLVGDVLYRIRVGEYRILYTIDDKIVTVTITKAAHRKDAYRT